LHTEERFLQLCGIRGTINVLLLILSPSSLWVSSVAASSSSRSAFSRPMLAQDLEGRSLQTAHALSFAMKCCWRPVRLSQGLLSSQESTKVCTSFCKSGQVIGILKSFENTFKISPYSTNIVSIIAFCFSGVVLVILLAVVGTEIVGRGSWLFIAPGSIYF